jgi:hypothetical protein
VSSLAIVAASAAAPLAARRESQHSGSTGQAVRQACESAGKRGKEGHAGKPLVQGRAYKEVGLQVA